MVKKAIDAEAKLAFWPCSSTKKMNQNCPRGNQPANSTIAKSQSNTMKNSQVEKSKVRGLELSVSQHSNNNEPSKKAWKKKKKEWRQRNQDCREGSILATRVNAAHSGEPYQKKNRDRLGRASRDTSQIKYYNCQKLCQYAN